MKQVVIAFIVLVLAVGCQSSPDPTEASEAGDRAEEDAELEVATFAGGCFWCMQPPFDELDGVESTVVGYTGGDEPEPTYSQVTGGQTGHVEAVEIRYRPAEVDYEDLLYVFWRSIDPTDDGGQFADRGDHYRTFVFYHDDTQRERAEASRAELGEEGPFEEPIVTEIVEVGEFWIAEEYHQDYYKKNPTHYESYYRGSGRAGFLEETWGEE